MKGLLSQLENTLGSLSTNSDMEFNGISIDSRNIKKGNLFIAIKGKNSEFRNCSCMLAFIARTH